jgi:hypothetical protein
VFPGNPARILNPLKLPVFAQFTMVPRGQAERAYVPADTSPSDHGRWRTAGSEFWGGTGDLWHPGSAWRTFFVMRRCSIDRRLLLPVLVLSLAGCATRVQAPAPVETPPPLPADTWREIAEVIWTASSLAQAEAGDYARATMGQWMLRITEVQFVPWYSSYWVQQWLGLKTGWYEMNRGDGDGAVDDYLVAYLQERFDEMVLEPAGERGNPRTITEQSAALYVRMLSAQLRCIPGIHPVTQRSLKKRLEEIPLILLPGNPARRTALSRVLEHDDLSGDATYQALLARTRPVAGASDVSRNPEPLQEVAKDAVARLVTGLPVRAGGGAAALVIGEALGLFISAGVIAWSAISHDRNRAEMESRLRAALDVALRTMWQVLMQDPETGVLYPVRHMSQQLGAALFPVIGRQPALPF